MVLQELAKQIEGTLVNNEVIAEYTCLDEDEATNVLTKLAVHGYISEEQCEYGDGYYKLAFNRQEVASKAAELMNSGDSELLAAKAALEKEVLEQMEYVKNWRATHTPKVYVYEGEEE